MVVPEVPVLVAFVVAALALNLTPGVDMVYVVGTTLRWSARSGVLAATGIAAGSMCHALLAACGLSALVAASGVAMDVITLVGAVYLVWSGVRMMRDATPLEVPPEMKPTERTGPAAVGSVTPVSLGGGVAAVRAAPSGTRLVLRGALVNLLNVKVIVFYLSFLPQFVDPERGSIWSQAAILGLLSNVLGTGVLVAVALLTGWFSGRGQASSGPVVVVRRVCGGVLVAMAVALTVSRFLPG